MKRLHAASMDTPLLTARVLFTPSTIARARRALLVVASLSCVLLLTFLFPAAESKRTVEIGGREFDKHERTAIGVVGAFLQALVSHSCLRKCSAYVLGCTPVTTTTIAVVCCGGNVARIQHRNSQRQLEVTARGTNNVQP